MTTQYAVLGLGSARSGWVSNVAAWSTAGAVPVEFSKCVSAAEVAQRLLGLRPYSAVLVESIDEVVMRAAAEAAVPVIMVSDANIGASGIAATFSPKAGPAELLGVLASYSAVVANMSAIEVAPFDDFALSTGQLIAVCGAGGTGASTLSIALAQEMAGDVMHTGLVALTDFARNAEQAMLHDAQDVIPGVEELVECHRNRRPGIDEVRSLTYGVPARGYDLVLGMRRPSAWVSMPTNAITNSLAGLRRTYRTVIADITADFEGEKESGSRDVEERNALARSSVLQADLVFVVANPSLKGVHSVARIARQLLDLGVGLDRIQIVVNRTAKRFGGQREIRQALRALVSPGISDPIFIKETSVEPALRDGTALPRTVAKPLRERVNAIDHPAMPIDLDRPVAVVPGSLGFYDEAVGQ